MNLNTNTSTPQIYDFIVIGSGIGGLVSALILAKHGYQVCVLEKNQQVGGALQTFSRDKCIFDTGVHYLGGLSSGDNLRAIFDYLEITEDLSLSKMDDAFDVIRLANRKIFKLGQGYENFIQLLLTDFPEEQVAIEQFVAKIKEICNYFPLYNLKNDGDKTYYKNSEVLAISAWDYLNSITKNQDLIATILGNGILYAGDIKRTPLHVVALILNSYISSSYRLVDGGVQIAKALVKQLRLHQGKIFKRKEVVSCETNKERVITAVTCSDGTSYLAKQFISNLHPYKTMETMGFEHFNRATKLRFSSLKNTVSAFTLHISLKPDMFEYFNHNHYDYFTDEVWNTVESSVEEWPKVIFSCTPVVKNQSKYATNLSALTYLDTRLFDEWKKTSNSIVNPQNRGEAYIKKKKHFEDLMIQKLCERYPKLKTAIHQVYSSTPLTFRDYLGNVEGELYGIEKDFNQSMMTVVNTRTKVPNLFLTGQNVIFHGILGSTIGAMVTCFNFVDSIRVLKEINRINYEQKV